MAAYSAHLRGASRIFVVDRVPERLAAAKKIPGCVPVDFSNSSGGADAVEQVIRLNDGKMVDRAIDAVGYQAVGAGKDAKEVPNVVLEQCIRVTRPTGGIGVPGLYVPSDPGAVDEKSGMGMMLMSFGKLFEKVGASSPMLSSPLAILVYFDLFLAHPSFQLSQHPQHPQQQHVVNCAEIRPLEHRD